MARNRGSGFPPWVAECRVNDSGMGRASREGIRGWRIGRIYGTVLGYVLFDITYIIVSLGVLHGDHRVSTRHRPEKR